MSWRGLVSRRKFFGTPLHGAGLGTRGAVEPQICRYALTAKAPQFAGRARLGFGVFKQLVPLPQCLILDWFDLSFARLLGLYGAAMQ